MKHLRRNLIVASAALLLNSIWEYAVCAYFYDNNVVFNMGKLMVEAIIVDVAVTLFFFNLIIFLRREKMWTLVTYDYVNLAVYGIAAAFYFESKALNISRWAYSEAMPLIGQSGIGLLPVLQFAVLIPLAVFAGDMIESKVNKAANRSNEK